MTTELQTKWIEALRSDEYKQGDGMLHNPLINKYCCLGVLCRVAEIPVNEGLSSPDRTYFKFKTDNDSSYIPMPEKSNFGLDKLVEYAWLEPDGEDDNPPKEVTIMLAVVDMNDHGKTFAEIADFLEANL